jgi:hypothetical protein
MGVLLGRRIALCTQGPPEESVDGQGGGAGILSCQEQGRAMDRLRVLFHDRVRCNGGLYEYIQEEHAE